MFVRALPWLAVVACSGSSIETPPPPNVAPLVRFVEPTPGAVVNEEDSLAVEVTVTDTEDLTQIRLEWSGLAEGRGPTRPGVDGRVQFELVDLDPGPASIGVRAVDAGGLAASAAVDLIVTPAPIDADNDGYRSDVDCDDTNPDIFPGATEICDGLDQDCDELIDEDLTITGYKDSDADGFGDADAAQEFCDKLDDGYVYDTSDCDDTSALVYPDAPELCDLLDNDCDMMVDEDVMLTFWLDADGDSFGDATMPTLACFVPPMHADNDLDCNDADPTINVNALVASEPADLATGIPNGDDVSVVLANADPLATLTLTGPDGLVSGVLFLVGAELTFEPDASLAADTTYTMDVTWQCGGVAQTTFTTGDFVTPVDANQLIGRAYRFDLLSGTIVNPAGAAAALSGVFSAPVDVLVGATAVGTDTLDLVVAAPDAMGQDLCAVTADAPGTEFSSNPAFEVTTPDVTLDVGGVTLPIEELRLSGVFEANLGSAIVDVEGRFDTRPVSNSTFGTDDFACTTALPPFGVTCSACTDGMPLCLDLLVTDVVGRDEAVALVSRTEADIIADPACP